MALVYSHPGFQDHLPPPGHPERVARLRAVEAGLQGLIFDRGEAPLADLEEVMLFRLTPDGQSLVEKHDVLKIRVGEAPDPALRGDDVVVVNRNTARATLRDSLFRDILDTINPFSATYRNAVTP